ncbi:protein ALP1-like isoform X2 [Exaiptasia diaphana]|uniref:DDE Tnp4 domain-containing protein n=1 Tax=Exaiptasia diaphana TaxID=2652724 RepID=A0A913X9R2_EXADI|nr:protein ALP1-like isoform X2 [Exaiptasia diaphana]KXJ13842.1 hypothetical protein AC249_AIPGENE4925 [Exaiptasia diaphana]
MLRGDHEELWVQKSNMAYSRRKDLDDILTVMMYQDSSSDEDSSDSDDDLDLLFLETLFPTPEASCTPRLKLEDLSDTQCQQMFRFEKQDLYRLRDALQVPANYICSQGTKATGLEGLLIMLRRLAYPNRWCDLQSLFGRSESELSLIFNEVIDDIYESHHHLIDALDLVWLDPQTFSQAIHAKGAPLDQCWGFIDGTPRPIARPIRSQRIMYSGHKRVHCLKFQSVQAPNGLIAHLFGPIEGRRHDAFMLGESGLADKLRPLQRPNGEPYVIYGDPAYGLTRNILAPFRGAQLTHDQQEFNRRMSKLRVAVEWGFGKICQQFAFLDFKKNMKVLLQPVGKYYVVAALLTNCHTCLYNSQTGRYFELYPPSLEDYLSNTR